MKLQIVGLVQLTILLKPLCQVGGSRKSADGGILLVPSKPSVLYVSSEGRHVRWKKKA